MFTVRLTPVQNRMCEEASRAEVERLNKIGAIDNGVGRKNYDPGRRLLETKLGMGGELAMALLLGAPSAWKPYSAETFKNKKRGDIFGIEVRSTLYKRAWLLMKSGDQNHLQRPYALLRASGDMFEYEFLGWLKGYAAMAIAEECSFGGLNQVWKVPQEKLRDPYELLERFCIVKEQQ